MKYALLTRVLHWLMAIMIFALLAIGFVMDDLPQPLKLQAIMLHKSFGTAIIILAVIRVITRLITKAPMMPEVIPAIQQRMAKLGHLGLYTLLFVMPFSGYLMSNFKGYPVALFGSPLPWLVQKNEVLGEIFEEVHELLAFAVIALVVIHIGAVLLHYKKEKINLLNRIW